MFYCDPCRIKREWPDSIRQSYGQCELCGVYSTCHDRQSSTLPLPKSFPKVTGPTRPGIEISSKSAEPANPQEVHYSRLGEFMALFTEEELVERPEWLVDAMLWFMDKDPGHRALMERLKDS